MKRSITFLGLMLLILSSCINELTDKINNIEESSWNPTLAVPLIVGDVTIGDLADELSQEDLDIVAGDDGTTTFVYRQPSIFSQDASELFAIPDQNFSTSLNAGADIIGGGPNATIDVNQDYSFTINSPEGDKLREITLKSGTLDINLSGNLPATGQISIQFNSVLKNDNPIVVDYSWTSTTSQSYIKQVDLSGAIIDLTDGNTTFNSFEFSSDLTINYIGNPISSSDGFVIEINLIDLNFELLTATFGNRIIAPDPSFFTLNFIEDIKQGMYFLEEPSMQFNVHNSIGAPVNIDLNRIIANSDTKGNLALAGSIIDNPIDIEYPTTIGDIKKTVVIIDETNSNLPQILAFQPDEIEYSFNGIVNPANNNDIHFVADTSSIKTGVILEVPLHGYINNIVIADEYDFDGSFLEDVDNEALIHITAQNGLPLDANIQAYFFDENNLPLDSLIYDDTNIFPAAKTDTDGNVTSPTQSNIDIVISNVRVEKLSRAKKMLFTTLLNTPDSPTKTVRFTDEDKLELSIYGQSQFNVEF